MNNEMNSTAGTVLMTCCNTRYATVEETLNHECSTEIVAGDRIKDTATGEVFTVVRVPSTRKRSYGVKRDGGTRELFVYRNELPRFVKLA